MQGRVERGDEGVFFIYRLLIMIIIIYYYACRAGWKEELKELISKLNISVAFDAIAGEMTRTIMEVIQTYHHQHRYFVRKNQT